MSEEVDTGEVVDNSQAVADMIERPENVPEKFWNTETKTTNNEAVLESYNQLSSKFGAFTGAPDSYEFTLNEQLIENGVELSADDPLISSFSELAKESNMSSEMANQLVNMFVESQYADNLQGGEAETARQAEEMGKLGDNSNQRIDNITNWAKANISAEQAEGLSDAMTTAAGVQAIEALIAKSKNAPMQTADVNPASQVNMAELQTLQFAKDDNGNRKMHTDPAYRKMVQDKFAQAMPGENIQTIG
jgi:hypothetical protein